MAKTSLKDKAKIFATSGALKFLPFIPRAGLDMVAKSMRKKVAKSFDDNVDGEDARTVRYKKGFALKMIDVFLATNKNLSPNCRYKLLSNVGNNAILKGKVLRQEFKKKHGFMPPSVTVFSPTMRCNLSCDGCYAFEYNKKRSGDLSLDLMRKGIDEARSFGQAFIVITGGEPYIRKEDLFTIFKEYNDMYFITYTNGTLIDEETAKRLEKLGNVSPCISVEGYGKETDARRGEGVHDKVSRAMKYLKEAGVPFAISVTVTRNNAELATTKEFLQFYADKGAYVAWFFQYMPLGKKPNVNLMVTPKQRNLTRRRIRAIRETRDLTILPVDFWGDGVLSNGCLAGGRGYIHISNAGRIEPCVFVQFSVDNLKDTTIAEAMKSKFMSSYRKAADKIDDLYRPCGVIDHPTNLREAVKAGRDAGEKVEGTHSNSDKIISDLAPEIDKFAAGLEKEVGAVWKTGKL